jgi:hypothetical protein
MKKVNLIKYLEVIGEGEYEIDINKGADIGEAIYEAAGSKIYFSSKDDCDYIDIAVNEYGADIIEEGALQAAQIGYEIEMTEKYSEHIEYWAENLEFEDLDEDIKEEIIKDIAENEMELKIIESVKNNNYDKYLQIIIDYTYADINE